MERLKIDLISPKLEIIKKAAEILKSGGLVICPTDTAYLLAADATREEAVGKIYYFKGRDTSKPIHIIVPDLLSAKKYAFFNILASKLAKKFWPGPLTLVLRKRKGRLAQNLTKDKSIGIRVPGLKLNLLLSQELGGPYTATSANKSGKADPYQIDDILSQFKKDELSQVNLILDAGKLKRTLPSTVVDLQNLKPRILRSGPIKIGKVFSTQV